VSLGGSLFGIVGMLFFIPLTSVLYALFREVVYARVKKKRESGELPKNPKEPLLEADICKETVKGKEESFENEKEVTPAAGSEADESGGSNEGKENENRFPDAGRKKEKSRQKQKIK